MLGLPAAAGAFDPALEGKNYAKVSERQLYVTGTPEFQTRLQQQNVEDVGVLERILLEDPERNPTNICSNRKNECAGDVRFYDWEESGYGVMTPVLFTARSGAVISGAVWAPSPGPRSDPPSSSPRAPSRRPRPSTGASPRLSRRPVTSSSPTTSRARASDTFGEAPDQQEGVPSQQGQPFFDGTEDALDFLLSTPGQPYDPAPAAATPTRGPGPTTPRSTTAASARAWPPRSTRCTR